MNISNVEREVQDIKTTYASLYVSIRLFFNLKALEKGINRKFSNGLDAHIFPAEQSMASVVVIDPNVVVKIHSHPQEQWAVLVKWMNAHA